MRGPGDPHFPGGSPTATPDSGRSPEATAPSSWLQPGTGRHPWSPRRGCGGGIPSSGGGPQLLWEGAEAQPPKKPSSNTEKQQSPATPGQHGGGGGPAGEKRGGWHPEAGSSAPNPRRGLGDTLPPPLPNTPSCTSDVDPSPGGGWQGLGTVSCVPLFHGGVGGVSPRVTLSGSTPDTATAPTWHLRSSPPPFFFLRPRLL